MTTHKSTSEAAERDLQTGPRAPYPRTKCPTCGEPSQRNEIARLRKNNAALRELVEYAATSSTVTTSDEPGCFWCDSEKHTRDCPARKALKVKP